MIYFKINEFSDIFLTLGESQTIASPYYFFELKDNLTSNIVSFSATNISSSTTRYDKFNIMLHDSSFTGSTSAGTAVLISAMTSKGEYNVYESDNEIVSAATVYNKIDTGVYRVDYDGYEKNFVIQQTTISAPSMNITTIKI